MPKDPTRQSENDSAPFARTSEAAAARRQDPDAAHQRGEPIDPPPAQGTDVNSEKISAVEGVGRANLMTPTRDRRPEERNPELDRKPADAGKR